MIICMFAQFGPGKPNSCSRYYPSDFKDTSENRLLWFQECLDKNSHPRNRHCSNAIFNWMWVSWWKMARV